MSSQVSVSPVTGTTTQMFLLSEEIQAVVGQSHLDAPLLEKAFDAVANRKIYQGIVVMSLDNGAQAFIALYNAIDDKKSKLALSLAKSASKLVNEDLAPYAIDNGKLILSFANKQASLKPQSDKILNIRANKADANKALEQAKTLALTSNNADVLAAVQTVEAWTEKSEADSLTKKVEAEKLLKQAEAAQVAKLAAVKQAKADAQAKADKLAANHKAAIKYAVDKAAMHTANLSAIQRHGNIYDALLELGSFNGVAMPTDNTLLRHWSTDQMYIGQSLKAEVDALPKHVEPAKVDSFRQLAVTEINQGHDNVPHETPLDDVDVALIEEFAAERGNGVRFDMASFKASKETQKQALADYIQLQQGQRSPAELFQLALLIFEDFAK